jgi:hypothetical protein
VIRGIRSIVHTRSFPVRLLMAVAVSYAVIAGLLAMHTLSAPHLNQGSTHAEVATAPHGTAPAPVGGEPMDAAAAPCDCAAPDEMPAHSMILMACVLALLVFLLLTPPSLVGTLGAPRSIAVAATEARGTLARARAPSLLVLSISRT